MGAITRTELLSNVKSNSDVDRQGNSSANDSATL